MSEKQRDTEGASDGASTLTDGAAKRAEAGASEASRGRPDKADMKLEQNLRQGASPRSGWSLRLALPLSLLALGLAVWLVYVRIADGPVVQTDPLDDAPGAALESRLDAVIARLAEHDARHQQLQAAQARLELAMERLGGEAAALESQLDTRLDRRLERHSLQLESAFRERSTQWAQDIDALGLRLGDAIEVWSREGGFGQRSDQDLARRLAMLEAAALLRIGQERAEWAGDLPGASLAYRQAEERLRGLDDPRLEQVRRAIAREEQALTGLATVDLTQTLARLERLTLESRSWPSWAGLGSLVSGEDEPSGDHEQAVAAPPEPWGARLSAMARALVRVQQRDELGRTDEQFDLARELLQLRLVAAQLALVRRDQDALRLQLNAARRLLDEWFDQRSEVVIRARIELDQLGSLVLEADLPPLGEALNRLQTLLERA